MAAMYDKPVRLLLKDMVSQGGLKPGEILQRDKVLRWFHDRYPKIKEATIHAHLTKMSTNVPSRIHYNASLNGEDDLFFRIDPSRYRLYEPANDPSPIYKSKTNGEVTDGPQELSIDETVSEKAASEFAYEKDLQSFLSKNLFLIEPGLRLFEDEGINGIEFPAGGRLIDILAVDKNNNYVVIELKVSRGYDRVVGQILRYMAWVEKHQANPGQSVRGVIIAKAITDDLVLATSRVKDVDLFEYELSVSLKKVNL
jgi:endonuclease